MAATPDGSQVWSTFKDTGKVQVFDAQAPFSLLQTLDTGAITNHVNIVGNANGMFAYVTSMDRLEAEVKSKDMTVFARIDHAAGATEVGLSPCPTLLSIFGNARAGTPLMQPVQTVGIDLTLKALVWQDAAVTTWLSYFDPSRLACRQRLGREVEGK
jgi:uncharacterized protein (DUF302 family)